MHRSILITNRQATAAVTFPDDAAAEWYARGLDAARGAGASCFLVHEACLDELETVGGLWLPIVRDARALLARAAGLCRHCGSAVAPGTGPGECMVCVESFTRART